MVMDIEIKNVILNYTRWSDIKGHQNALNDSVKDIEKIIEERINEKLEELIYYLDDKYSDRITLDATNVLSDFKNKK